MGKGIKNLFSCCHLQTIVKMAECNVETDMSSHPKIVIIQVQ